MRPRGDGHDLDGRCDARHLAQLPVEPGLHVLGFVGLSEQHDHAFDDARRSTRLRLCTTGIGSRASASCTHARTRTCKATSASHASRNGMYTAASSADGIHKRSTGPQRGSNSEVNGARARWPL